MALGGGLHFELVHVGHIKTPSPLLAWQGHKEAQGVGSA